MKILFIDIETAPAIVYTYDLFQPVIGHKQIIESSRIICFSAQWQGSKKTLFYSEYHDTREGMLKALYDLLDEADVVVGYNSKRFDTPWIEGELLAEGFGRPSPSKPIDLFQVVKQHSRFLSKKLDYVSERLLGDKKIDVNTMMLAIECVYGPEEGREKAWKKMKSYSCLTPDHKVLTTDLRWVEIGSVEVGDEIVGFDEEPNLAGTLGRRIKPSRVLGNRRVIDDVYAVTLSNGDVVKTTADHQWLTRAAEFRPSGIRLVGGSKWRRTDQLIDRNGKYLSGKSAPGLDANPTVIDKFTTPVDALNTYESGWLAGMLDGEGSLSVNKGNGPGNSYVGGFQVSVSQRESETLDRLFKITSDIHPGNTSLSLSEPRQDGIVKQRHRMGHIRIGGNHWDKLQFLSLVRPERLIANLNWDRMPRLEGRGRHVTVESVRYLGKMEIVILETDTETYIADGYPMHNCKDTALMLPLFDILRPYIKMPHPVNESDPNSCHTCGSTNLQRRGYSLTLTGRYQRFACQDCGSWHRGTTRLPVSDIRALS